LVITPFFPSEKSFVGSYIFDQVNEIRNQSDFNVEIIKVVSLFSREKDYEYKGFRVKLFKIIDIPFFIFPGIFNFINKLRFSGFLKRNIIENISVSHAHVSYPSSYLQNDLKGKKIVQHHGLDVLQLLNGRSKIIAKIQKNYLIRNTIKQLNKSDLNIGVSQLVLDQLKPYSSYKPKGELVLYNGVDTSKFFPNKKKKSNKFTIGCVANFWNIKDQITLIKAVHGLSSRGIVVELKLIGSGIKLESCKKYVEYAGLNKSIIFEKEIKHKELNIFFNQIDLFVLPSYYEALGCVYMESWATNTPFIAVIDQGISELIPEGLKNKMLVSKSDEADLAKKILYFMNNEIEHIFNPLFDIKNTISTFLKNKIFND